MYRNTIYALLIILILIFDSCSEGNQTCQLNKAAAIVDEKPDSAYRIISAIDTTMISGRDRARYALLKTQSLIKKDSVVTNTNLIDESISFFKSHGPSDDLMKSQYYRAWICYYLNESYDAMTNAIEAYEIAQEENDDYWTARIAELISIIFFNNYNLPEAEKYSVIASDYYKKVGRDKDYNYCLIDQATYHVTQRKYKEALKALEYMTEGIDKSDTIMTNMASAVRLHALYGEKRYAEADSVFTEMELLSSGNLMDANSNRIKTKLSCYNRNTDKAELYLKLCKESITDINDSISYVAAAIALAVLRNDYKTAYNYSNKLLRLNDLVSRQNYLDRASMAHRDFFQLKAENERIDSMRNKMVAISLSIGLIIILSAVLIIYRTRLRVRDLEIERQAKELYDITQLLESQKTESSNLQERIKSHEFMIKELNDKYQTNNIMVLREKIHKAFKQNWKIIGSFCKTLKDVDPSDSSTTKSIIKCLNKEIADLRSEKNLNLIENFVNDFRDGLMAKARLDLPELSRKDFQLLCLLFSGMDPQVIAVFMDISRNSLGPAKSRLIKKIQSYSSDNALYYANLLS